MQDAGAGIFAEVEHRRDQDQPLHADALLDLQVAHKFRPAYAAVALPGDEFRRRQAIVLFQPAPDRHRDRADVAVNGKELLAYVFAGRDEAAIAGADRIDVNKVGEVEPGLGVRLQVGGSGRRHLVRVDGEPPRAIVAKLQPGGGRTRTAVEDERHRARDTIGAIQLIGRVGNIGLRLALIVEQADRACGRSEGKVAAGKIEALLGRRIRRQLVLLGGRLCCGGGGTARALPGLLPRRRGRRGRLLGADLAGDQNCRKSKGDAEVTRWR